MFLWPHGPGVIKQRERGEREDRNRERKERIEISTGENESHKNMTYNKNG